MTMNAPATAPAAEMIQRARCSHLKEMLEPWSIRRLAARTGLTKSAVESIYNGNRDLSIADVAVIAPVLRMTPSELFDELMGITGEPEPTNVVKLPGLDSNQQPIGSLLHLDPSRRKPAADRGILAPVTALPRARSIAAHPAAAGAR